MEVSEVKGKERSHEMAERVGVRRTGEMLNSFLCLKKLVLMN